MGLPWVSWDCLGALLGRPGAVLGRLGANVGPSGTPRRRPRAVLGPSWGVLEPIGANLEPQEGAGSGPMRAPRGSQEASWTAIQHRVRFGALHVHEMLFFAIRNAPPGETFQDKEREAPFHVQVCHSWAIFERLLSILVPRFDSCEHDATSYNEQNCRCDSRGNR